MQQFKREIGPSFLQEEEEGAKLKEDFTSHCFNRAGIKAINSCWLDSTSLLVGPRNDLRVHLFFIEIDTSNTSHQNIYFFKRDRTFDLSL